MDEKFEFIGLHAQFPYKSKLIHFRMHVAESKSKVLLDRIGKREVDAGWNMTGHGWSLAESNRLWVAPGGI